MFWVQLVRTDTVLNFWDELVNEYQARSKDDALFFSVAMSVFITRSCFQCNIYNPWNCVPSR